MPKITIYAYIYFIMKNIRKKLIKISRKFINTTRLSIQYSKSYLEDEDELNICLLKL